MKWEDTESNEQTFTSSTITWMMSNLPTLLSYLTKLKTIDKNNPNLMNNSTEEDSLPSGLDSRRNVFVEMGRLGVVEADILPF